MNRYVKQFLHRGLIFGGFGPVILGIIFYFIDLSGTDLMLDGGSILLAILSIYVLAFVQAGASVFNQIEHWSVGKSLFFHFSSLFLVSCLTYILNSWIPFEPAVLLIFCLVFVAVYFATWLTVYFSTKAYTKRLNNKLK